MALQGNKILAVVPARGGSKSIPHKNLCKVGGVSLLGRAAQIAFALPWIDRAVLSTDDDRIIREGKAFGLSAPFLRPAKLASDSANSIDVWRHAWLACEDIDKTRYDISILLEPTSPLRTPTDVEATVRTLIRGDYKAAATVSPTPAHYSPQKSLLIKGGRIRFYLADGARYSIRQKIPQYFHRNGICYAVTRDTLIKRRHILEEDCAAVIVGHPAVNIDESYELELAEWLLAKKHLNKK